MKTTFELKVKSYFIFSNRQNKEEILKEGRILALLKHDNIVRYYDIFQINYNEKLQ